MKIKNISFPGLLGRMRALFFFLMNRAKYKKLAFGALVLRPLRLNGTRYMSIGENTVVQDQACFFALKIDDHEPELIIHEGCLIGYDNHIAAVRKVVIGRNVLTANRVYISDNIHGFKDVHTPIMFQPVECKGEVSIGDGSWIGENVCIIGARIGKNCVIGANAVVTRDIPDYCVAVGSPARVIKQYNPATKKWESA